jgi:hypothetical protein
MILEKSTARVIKVEYVTTKIGPENENLLFWQWQWLAGTLYTVM